MQWRAKGPGGQAEVANSPIVLPGDRVLVTTWEQAAMLRPSHAGGRVFVRNLREIVALGFR